MRSVAFFVASLFFCVLTQPLRATVYTVSNAAQTGPGSLRDALGQANSHLGADSIVFTGAVFATKQTITLLSELGITDTVTIQGPAAGVVISGGDNNRIFACNLAATSVTLVGLELVHGTSTYDPVPTGAISAENHVAGTATLALVNCSLHDNPDWGVYALGVNVSLEGCTLTNESVHVIEGAVTALNSNFLSSGVANMPAFDLLGGSVTATDCTFSGRGVPAIQNQYERLIDGLYRGGPLTGSFTRCTFTNNSAGLSLLSATIAFTDCTFDGNGTAVDASDDSAITMTGSGVFNHTGPGLKVRGSSALTLSNCEIRDGGDTGVIVGSDTPLTASDCTITGNHSTENGGGISAENVVLTRVVVRNNSADGVAGGILCGDGTLTDCTISNNTAVRGGGLQVSGGTSSTTFRNCTISGNTATGSGATFGEGGGLWTSARVTFVNCTLSGNTAAYRGGAILATGGETLELQSCTITANTALDAGGLDCTGPRLKLGNSIIAANVATDPSPDIGSFVRATGLITSLGHNVVGVFETDEHLIDGVNGDRVGTSAHPLDPRLAALADNGGLTKTHALLPDSPALEAGDDSLITAPLYPGAPFLDQRGQPRSAGSATDIGAYELITLEVTNTNDSGAGSLRDRIATANTGGGGVISFRGSVFNASLQTITLTTGQLSVTAPLSLIGPAGGVKLSGNNASRVMNIAAPSVVLKHLRFANGNSTADGGGLRISGAGTTVTLEDITISGCVANGRGGGLYAQDNSTVSITRSTISGNDADDNGGGLHFQPNTLLRLTNSTVSGNRSKQGGGGLFATNGTFTVINCTFSENRADFDNLAPVGDGGGMRFGGGANPIRVGNTIIAGNSDDSAGVVHPDVSGAFESLGHNLVGIRFGVDTATGVPFTNGVLGDQVGSTGTPLDPRLGALAFTPASSTTRVHPLLNASTARDAGDSALLDHNAWPSYPATDQRGQSRVLLTGVDIGAVEWPDNALVYLTLDDNRASEYGPHAAVARVRRSFDDGTDKVINLARDAASTSTAADYAITGGGYASTGASTFTLTIPAGRTVARCDVTPVDDAFIEGTETLVLNLQTGAGYAVDPGATNTRTIDILDNEFTVTSNANSGAGSLRAALNAAGDAGGGIITIPTPLTITLGGTPLPLNGAISIIGQGTTLDAAGLSRVLDVTGTGTGTSTLRDLIFTNGHTPAGEDGGGVRITAGSVAFERCAFVANLAENRGGGLFVDAAEASLLACSLSLNSSLGGSGGGIGTAHNAGLILTNTTLGQNTSNQNGGGIAAIRSTVALLNCTLADNNADNDNAGGEIGGGIYNGGQSTVILGNTALVKNLEAGHDSAVDALAPDLGGTGIWRTLGHNYVNANKGAPAAFPVGFPNANGDTVRNDPIPTPLTAILTTVTGPWLRYEPKPNSNLVDRGDNILATTTTDQRGWPRIQHGTVEVGAVEMDYFWVTNGAASGAGSLRQAVLDANTLGHGSIRFDTAGGYFNQPRTINLGGSQLTLTAAGSIEAPDSASFRVSITAGNASRALKITPSFPAAVTISHVDFLDGNTTSHAATDQNGAGIFVGDNTTLTLDDCTVRDGTSPKLGGGVYVSTAGALTATACTFSGNDATTGGAIALIGSGTFEQCTFDHNGATLDGGALASSDQALTLTNCTISSNTANRHGGGLANLGTAAHTVALTFCTLTLNTANADNAGGGVAGGISTAGGTVSLLNTIVSGNDALAATADDLAGTFASAGHNLVGIVTGSTGFTHGVNGDLVGVPAYLGPLQFNGGTTWTHALLAGSSAIDAAATVSGARDQRNFLRTGTPDIGAYDLFQESYGFWSKHTFPSGAALTGETDDYDGDGFINALEFGAGSNATSAASVPRIAVSTVGGSIAFDLPVSPLAPTDWNKLQVSTDLVLWATTPTGTATLFAADPVRNVYVYRALVPVSSYSRLFARLRYVP